MSRVTVLLAARGHDDSTFLKRYVVPLLAAGRASAAVDVCVHLDAWSGSPHLTLLSRARNAIAAVKGSAAAIAGPQPRSLVDALTSWQQQFNVCFILVFDQFDAFLSRPIDDVVLDFHQQLADVLNQPALRIHALIALDEQADPALSPLRYAVPGFGDACLRLLARRRTASERANRAQESRADIVAGSAQQAVSPAPAVNEIAEMSAPVFPAQPESVALLSSQVETPVQVEAEPVLQATIIEPSPIQNESPAILAEIVPVPAPDSRVRVDAATRTPSRLQRYGWFALVVILLSLSLSWVFAPRPVVKPAPAQARAVAAEPPEAPARKPMLALTADVPAEKTSSEIAQPPVVAAARPAQSQDKPVVQGTPQLYIHVRTHEQRARAETLVKTLAERGVRVGGITLVTAGPTITDLRYFRTQEGAEAEYLARALKDVGIVIPKVKHIAGYEGIAAQRRYELWLAR
ncbi:MAG: hypothetical protein V4637_12060 [Pseudomonadota bacterium]